MYWPKVTIHTACGEKTEAIAPAIVSASRATDIPAFYGEWFKKRLDEGYVRWTNPFSGRHQYVSLERTRFFVFWSKNPRPFLPLLRELDKRGITYYFHFTLNNYEDTMLESGLPPLTERLETFVRLSSMIGRERTLWRCDPLITSGKITIVNILDRIRRVGDRLFGHTERMTVSFVTLYAKVARNLIKYGADIRTDDAAGRERILDAVGKYAHEWKMTAVSCADGNNYDRFGIARGKCVDDALIARLSAGDRELGAFLIKHGSRKDSGQRPHCRCIISKDIGQYNTCGHGCLYCYANASPARARANLARHTTSSDAIIP
jgi:hypothetical protein